MVVSQMDIADRGLKTTLLTALPVFTTTMILKERDCSKMLLLLFQIGNSLFCRFEMNIFAVNPAIVEKDVEIVL
jgi:hypothetical protein